MHLSIACPPPLPHVHGDGGDLTRVGGGGVIKSIRRIELGDPIPGREEMVKQPHPGKGNVRPVCYDSVH